MSIREHRLNWSGSADIGADGAWDSDMLRWGMQIGRRLYVFRAVRPPLTMAAALGLLLAAGTDARGAQVPAPGAWAVRAVDEQSGSALSGVVVFFPSLQTSRLTNSSGLAELPEASDSLRVVATRIGYAELDTLVSLSGPEAVVELRMARAPVSLQPLTVEVDRRLTSRELHRLLFEREVAIGAFSMTQAEIEAVPPIGEPDVFRSLQAFAGVSSLNDYSGQLHVRGGDGDQVRVLLDGAPVFAPYHMFGLFGVFNTGAIESTEFYRGSVPARYGGALSGVMSARSRTGSVRGTSASGGVSVLGVRVAASGAAPWAGIRWMAAGRKASVDIGRISIPYSFEDLNFGLEAHPAEQHRLRVSLLASDDDFAWRFGDDATSSLSSAWENLTSSLSWSWVRDDRLASDVTAYYSRYRGEIGIGDTGGAGPVTHNRIAAAGLRANVLLRGENAGLRAGVAFEEGPVDLRGSRPGAYLESDASRSYLHISAFAEAERSLGPVRLAPGIRAGTERRSSHWFVEPRFSVRWHTRAFALSLSLDRTYQFMSQLTDARSDPPGAPMWFVHPEGRPASLADGLSVSADAWRGDDWTASAAAWTRRFRNRPHWRPGQPRDLSALEFHDGAGHGIEVTLRKHSGRVRGWLSYQWARVAFEDANGDEYFPPWDRRHEVDGTLTARVVGGLEVSVRGTVGTGAPFWFPAGRVSLVRYDPSQRLVPGDIGGLVTDQAGSVTLWSSIQGRVPTYARYDVSMRYVLRWGSAEVIPYGSVVNVAYRKNVLSYWGVGSSRTVEHKLLSHRQLPLFPFLGVDFRF